MEQTPLDHQTSDFRSDVTTRSVGTRYGLIAALVGIAYFLVLNVLDVDVTSGAWNWAGSIFTIVILVLAHQYFKQNNAGFMSYQQGFSISLWMALVSSAISSVFTYIYVKFIDDGFIGKIKEKQIQAMEEQGMSDEQIDQAMGIASMFMSAEAMLIMGLIGGIIVTIIIGLIVSIFTQKKAPETAF